jgi:hypothetical protein
MAEYSPKPENYPQPERGLQRLGDGIFEIVGPARSLDPGTTMPEAAQSDASQAAAGKNTERYWQVLLELQDELLERVNAGDQTAASELTQLRREMRGIYQDNAGDWGQQEGTHSAS